MYTPVSVYIYEPKYTLKYVCEYIYIYMYDDHKLVSRLFLFGHFY